MHTLIVIVGPTAIGKTALAIELAKHFQCEIISADSRQFFKEMAIGTAKPSEKELHEVKHHFINSHSIHDEISVGSFEKEALIVLDRLFKRNRVQILVGGSGLYMNAVCEGFDELPDVPASIRQQLNQEFKTQGIAHLQEKLKALDLVYYQQVDRNNPQRIIRALEVCLATGKPFSSFRLNVKKERPFEIMKIGLNTSRKVLYERINQRVNQMMQDGLIEEVKSLVPYRHLNALNTVGYNELFDYFDHKYDLDTAIERIKQNTRRFAKRQLTWFRKNQSIHWFNPNQTTEILNFLHHRLHF